MNYAIFVNDVRLPWLSQTINRGQTRPIIDEIFKDFQTYYLIECNNKGDAAWFKDKDVLKDTYANDHSYRLLRGLM